MNEPVSTNTYAQLVNIATREDDASEIESFLRESGLPVRMTWLEPNDELSDRLKEINPDIAFCDERVLEDKPDALRVCTGALPYTPVLLLVDQIDIGKVTQVMQQRARDVVSVNQPDHLRAVYMRELGVCRLQQHLNHAQGEVDALEDRLYGFMNSIEAAVVNVQEGIIVEANERFAQLFGYDNHEAAVGMPFMDQIHGESQAEVKKKMSRCAKGKAMADSLSIKAVTTGGSDFNADMEIKYVQYDGEPAIELQIKSDSGVAPEKDLAVEETKESPREKVTQDEASDEADQRTRLYRTLENPKHYPPNSEGLSIGFIVVDQSAKLKEQLGLAGTEQFLSRLPVFLNKQLPGAKVYRLATEEFVLIAPGKLFKHGESLSRNFCKQISEEIFDFEGKSVVFTISIAINLIDTAKNSGHRFAEARDDARKLSSSGGNQVMICAAAKKAEQTVEPIQWEELQTALSSNKLRMATRPIASLEGENRQYFEVYPRIPGEHGELKPIENGGPQDTHTKLQIELDRRLILLALSAMKKAADNHQQTGMFVPISSCSLEQSESTFKWLLEQKQKLKLAEQEIVFALFEGAVTPHIHRLKELIGKLEPHGVKFAIANCSGNEQSMRLIQNLPAHFMRLTGKATSALCDSKNKNDSLHEAVSIAREQGYKIVAASTGDAHSMAVLWQLGVNYVEAADIDEPAAA